MAQLGQDDVVASFFVGSPDALPISPRSRSSRPSFHAQGSSNTIPHPSHGSGISKSLPEPRPTLDRSLSSPVVSPVPRQSRHSLRSTVVHSPEREWSLFGQLMENEWPTTSTPRKLRRRNATHTPTNPFERSPVRSGLTPDPDASQASSRLAESVVSVDPASLDDQPLRHYEEIDPYDSDSDSEQSSGEQQRPLQVTPSPSSCFQRLHIPTLPPIWRNVLKCSLAYFIGSLFTFVPYLSGFLSDITSSGKWDGPSPSGHMVATVTVYFNPAKTIGGMVEADIYVIFGLAFTSFVSLGSMGMFWFLEVRPGWEWLGDALVLFWVAAAMCVMAWLKVWIARPTFNSACSMMCIILFVVIVKEGGWETLLQVSFIVLVGAAVSNIICLNLWMQSATKNLQADMKTALDSFVTVLEMLTRTFLLDPDFHPKESKLHRAVEAHQKSFTSLKRNLAEAHSEWLCSPLRRGANSVPYDDAVDSLNRLAQHLGGLRSGTRLQADLTRAHREGKLVLQHGIGNTKLFVPASQSGKESTGQNNTSGTSKRKTWDQDEEDNALLAAAATMFGDLVDDLGPPLSALSNTCASTLKRMKNAFEKHHQDDSINSQEFFQASDDIERALFTFDSTSNHAVMRLYRRSDMTDHTSIFSEDGAAPVLASGDNETVFLVYFFIFTLQEFAKELVSLVDAMGRIDALERRAAARSHPWKWIKDRLSCLRARTRPPSPGSTGKSRPGLRRQLSTLVPIESTRPKAVRFPKVRPHAPNTMQTPSRASLSVVGRVKQSFWTLGKRLKEPDLKYAFKTGVATAMLASPAFFHGTRQLFIEFRGEWALLSFFVVMSPTIGTTNFLSLHRVGATFLGAFLAVIVYLAFHKQPIVLALFGFFYSIPCFYYLLTLPQYAASIRFLLLTYNLTCLYCYNRRFEQLSVIDVAYHRAVAVTAGVLWAFIVSQFWWPTEARRELSKALSEFCQNIGWLYTRMVMNYSAPPDALLRVEPQGNATVTTPLLSGRGRSMLPARASDQLSSSIHDFMAMELHLQLKLITLQGLLAQTQHEPRLKGPFPVKLYRSILTSLQTVLDKLHSMRCVTTREEWYTTVRRDFILPVTKERREMVGNVILYFSTLSAAFRLKTPLPPYLPPAEKSRQELVRAIRNLDVVKTRDVKGSRQLLYFAYALMMKGVIQELDFLGKTLQDAFGVLGGNTEGFENLFRAEAIEHEEAAPTHAVLSDLP